MIRLTKIEAEALEVVEMVQEFFSRKDASRMEFMEVMGHLRDLRVKLINRKFGCPSGKHATDCLCEEPQGYF